MTPDHVLDAGSGPTARDRARRNLQRLRGAVAGFSVLSLLLGVGAAHRFFFEWRVPIILHFSITLLTLGLLMLIWLRVHRPAGVFSADRFTMVGRIRMTGLVGGMALVAVAFLAASIVGLRSEVNRPFVVIPYVIGILGASLAFVGPLRMTARRQFAAATIQDRDDAGGGGNPDDTGVAGDIEPAALPDAEATEWAATEAVRRYRIAYILLVGVAMANHLSFSFWSGLKLF